jgi:hypothetical protein
MSMEAKRGIVGIVLQQVPVLDHELDHVGAGRAALACELLGFVPGRVSVLTFVDWDKVS